MIEIGWEPSIHRFPMFDIGLRLVAMGVFGNIIILLTKYFEYTEDSQDYGRWMVFFFITTLLVLIFLSILFIMNTHRMRELTKDMIVKSLNKSNENILEKIREFLSQHKMRYEEKQIEHIYKLFLSSHLETIHVIIDIESVDIRIIIWNQNNRQIKNKFGDFFIGPIFQSNILFINELIKEIDI